MDPDGREACAGPSGDRLGAPSPACARGPTPKMTPVIFDFERFWRLEAGRSARPVFSDAD